MKSLLLSFFICIGSTILFAQSPSVIDLAKNEMKYWKLRGRITADDNIKDIYNGFMTIGLGAGKSIPANQRLPIYNQNWWFYDPNSVPKGDCSNQGIYNQSNIDTRDNNLLKGINHWEDNPLVNLGNYLGVLATEWDLLHKNGSST